jgi:hypothetical protein
MGAAAPPDVVISSFQLTKPSTTTNSALSPRVSRRLEIQKPISAPTSEVSTSADTIERKSALSGCSSSLTVAVLVAAATSPSDVATALRSGTLNP